MLQNNNKTPDIGNDMKKRPHLPRPSPPPGAERERCSPPKFRRMADESKPKRREMEPGIEWAPVAGQAEAVPAVPRNAPSASATTICKRISIAAVYRLQRAG